MINLADISKQVKIYFFEIEDLIVFVFPLFLPSMLTLSLALISFLLVTLIKRVAKFDLMSFIRRCISYFNDDRIDSHV